MRTINHAKFYLLDLLTSVEIFWSCCEPGARGRLAASPLKNEVETTRTRNISLRKQVRLLISGSHVHLASFEYLCGCFKPESVVVFLCLQHTKKKKHVTAHLIATLGCSK